MTIRHLNTFVTVCELKSISKAAIKLNVAQPAVSQTIAELERYYGVPLFLRINNKIFLTPEAEDLCRKAREIINSFNEFHDLAKSKEVHPSLTIGASLTVATIYLSKIIKTINEKFSNFNLKVKVNNALEIQQQIENGIIDFAIIEGKPSLPDIAYDMIKKDKLVFVTSNDFDIPKTISLSDVTKYPLLTREKGSFSRDYLANKIGLDMSPMLESNSNQSIITSCISGAGIAFLPRLIVEKYLKEKSLKEVKIKNFDLGSFTSLIWYEKRKFSKAFTSVIDEIKEIISLNVKESE